MLEQNSKWKLKIERDNSRVRTKKNDGDGQKAK
jgi:hypothetical protein